MVSIATSRHLSFIDKPVSAFSDYKNKVCRISVVPAANSVYRFANFNNVIHTGKPISGHS